MFSVMLLQKTLTNTGYFGSQFWRIKYTMVGQPEQQMLKAAGHKTSTIRKQGLMNAASQSFLQPRAWYHPQQMVLPIRKSSTGMPKGPSAR